MSILVYIYIILDSKNINALHIYVHDTNVYISSWVLGWVWQCPNLVHYSLGKVTIQNPPPNQVGSGGYPLGSGRVKLSSLLSIDVSHIKLVSM